METTVSSVDYRRGILSELSSLLEAAVDDKRLARNPKFSLLLTTRFGNAVAANTWNTYTWKPALAKAGVIPPRAKGAKDWQWEAAPKDGFHVLRHTYASIMLEAGGPW